MIRVWLSVVAITAWMPAGTAFAQCVSSIRSPLGGYSSIGFREANTLVGTSNITGGVNYWTGACGNDGTSFPTLKANQTGTVTISVRLEPGTSTTSSGGCGEFIGMRNSAGQLTGGSIVLFDADALGHDCEPRRSNTIAHEIGHVLGLGHSTCAGYIMSSSGNRTVQTAECEQADAQWETAEEIYQQELQQCEATCPLPCTGNPPVCDTTIDTGGGYQCPFSQCSPLILDLNGDGIHTTSVAQPVSFDLTGDGQPEQMGWTHPSTEEAFLWIDLKQNGRVDDGSELFGNGTILHSGARAGDGFQALAEHDTPALGGNADGRISSEDAVWNRLRLWVDGNHDGTCVPAENGPIAEYGVEEILLTYSIHERRDPHGNVQRLRGAYSRWMRGHGAPRLVWLSVNDVFFATVP